LLDPEEDGITFIRNLSTYYPPTTRNIPEDLPLQQHHRVNLPSLLIPSH